MRFRILLEGWKGTRGRGDRLLCQGILLHGIRINWRCNVEGATMQEPLGDESFALETPMEGALASTRNRVSEIETSRLSEGFGLG